jgi:hypothetical protein
MISSTSRPAGTSDDFCVVTLFLPSLWNFPASTSAAKMFGPGRYNSPVAGSR